MKSLNAQSNCKHQYIDLSRLQNGFYIVLSVKYNLDLPKYSLQLYMYANVNVLTLTNITIKIKTNIFNYVLEIFAYLFLTRLFRKYFYSAHRRQSVSREMVFSEDSIGIWHFIVGRTVTKRHPRHTFCVFVNLSKQVEGRNILQYSFVHLALTQPIFE